MRDSDVDAHALPGEECAPEGCGAGRYCDLGMGRCVEGCASDEGCDFGSVCESRRCVPGCRGDEGCPARHVCTDGMCEVGCRECPEDGEECTASMCIDGECAHVPVRDDASCGAPELCSYGACRAGRCERLPFSEARSCSDWGIGRPISLCVDLECAAPPVYCSVIVEPDGSRAIRAPRWSPSGQSDLADSCGCNGDRMEWQWSVRLADGEHGSETCSRCIELLQPPDAVGRSYGVVGCFP